MLTSSANRKEVGRLHNLGVADVAATVVALVAIVSYSAISLYRHNSFGSTIDLATQTQTIWGYSQLKIIPNTVIGIPNLLGDHFHPILVVLAPLFWIWDSAAVLLIAQAVLLGVAGIPLYLWAAELMGKVAGLAFLAAFYVYWGILAGVLFDFHHIVFAVASISWALYATVTRRNRLLGAMVVVAMLSREDVALTLIALGFYIVAVQRRFLIGGVVMVVNAAWFALIVGVVMPALAGAPYRHWNYSDLGPTPASGALHILRHPISSLELLFTPITKARVWIASFGNWLFLPLISPLILVAIPSFLARFWNDQPDLWNFHMHYSMMAAPILAFAAIDGAARFARLWPAPRHSSIGSRVALVVLAASIVLSIAINPLAELGTYGISTALAADIQSCLDVIPPTAGVASTQTLLPHLATRMQIYEIPIQQVGGPTIDPISAGVQYIAIDMASEGDDTKYRTVVQEALQGGYGVACTKELTVILEKGASSQALSAPLERWLAGDCNGLACLRS